MIDELRNARPDWGILTEETGEIDGDPNKPRWIVDPLDGTTNFLHGVPHFAISIAVEEPQARRQRAEISHGLVYQPLTDESFWAEKGRGAWLNDRRLRVSARRNLDEALIGTGIPHFGRGDVAAWSRIFGAIAPEVSGIRRLGSASARFRLGRGRAGSTASGKTISTSGTAPRACCWSRKPAVSSAIIAGRTGCSSAANIWPRAANCTASCTSCLPGALR